MKDTGIIICGCRGEISQRLNIEELARSLPSSFPVYQSAALCETPQEIAKFLELHQATSVVIGACSEEECLNLFRKQVRQCGRNPFSLELVNIREQCTLVHTAAEANVKARLMLCAQALRPQNEIGPENLKASFGAFRGRISRRELFSLVTPRYQVIPNIKGEICTSRWGCRLCLASCPAQALREEAGGVCLDKNRCEGCGACISACPWDAIHFPLFTPELVDQQLSHLLSGDLAPLDSRILLVICKGSEKILNDVAKAGGVYPASVVPLRLPCLTMLSPFLVLRAFALGAEAVALLPCAQRCLYGFDLEKKIHRQLRFLRSLMPHLGIGKERLQVLDREPQSLATHLDGMAAVLETQGCLNLKKGAYSLSSPFSSLVLAKLLQETKATDFILEGHDVPFGLVDIQAELCSACRLCTNVCLSRALVFEKKDSKLELVFHHSRCIACGECVRVCPERAISVRRILDSHLLQQPKLLLQAGMIQCHNCGKDVAPGPVMAKIQQKLEQDSVKAQGTLYLCPSCRLKHLSRQGSVASVANKDITGSACATH